MGHSLIKLVLSGGIVGQSVLLILLLTSIVSWGIILYKLLGLRRARSENRAFLALFSKTGDCLALRKEVEGKNKGPMALLFLEAMEKYFPDHSSGTDKPTKKTPMLSDRMERFLGGEVEDEMIYQERYLHLLAIVGNTAPFVGLFGTVWGIMGAFNEIGLQGSADLAVVAPGVAEALVNTAAGLLAAIPAVVAYNIFVHQLRGMEVQLNLFVLELLSLPNLISRDETA